MDCAIVFAHKELTSGNREATVEMGIGRLLQRSWVRAALIIGAWTVLAAFLTSQMYLAYSRREIPIRWERIFLVELIYAYIWAALTPLILWLARRFPIERWKWIRSMLVHLGVSLFIGFSTRVLHDLMLFYVVSDAEWKFSLTKLLMNVYS